MNTNAASPNLDESLRLSPEEAEKARKAYLLQRFLISARGFWGLSGEKVAWICTLGLLLLIVANLGFQYGFNLWNRKLFDAIEQRNSDSVTSLAKIFPPLVIGSVSLVTAQVYFRMLIQRRWRSWLTQLLTARWLAHGRYYQLNLIDGDHQNPERAFRKTCALQQNRRSTLSRVFSSLSCLHRPLSSCSGRSAAH